MDYRVMRLITSDVPLRVTQVWVYLSCSLIGYSDMRLSTWYCLLGYSVVSFMTSHVLFMGSSSEFISHDLSMGSSSVSLFLMFLLWVAQVWVYFSCLFIGSSSVSLFLMSFHRLLKCEFFYVHITSIKYLINISNANSLMFLNVNNSGKYFLLKHM